ncbi:hypothetical protein QT969_10350 [Rhodococcus sp. CSLK01-03]|uniref:Uncharacterized protein n=1 Tax=Rhodococcus indonesiensis TaxID=3055869 RepID=A0ABT7RM21_9NOCA|nr:hypothetical protein [Rhodococcus indonesiensis]MDM7488691.1 hypothetical protein [Rhodococcus indonesiensis]
MSFQYQNLYEALGGRKLKTLKVIKDHIDGENLPPNTVAIFERYGFNKDQLKEAIEWIKDTHLNYSERLQAADAGM